MQLVLTIAFFCFLLELPTTCCSTITSSSDFFLVVYPSPRSSPNAQVQCRIDCANAGGFVAWIFSSQDNNQIVSLLTTSTTGGSFTVGGSRQPFNSTWYWNEYPPKVLSRNALGVPFWQGIQGGSALNNMYTNFHVGEPGDGPGLGETQLSYYYTSGSWKWNDIGMAISTSGCVCRWFGTPTPTASTTALPTASRSPGFRSTTASRSLSSSDVSPSHFSSRSDTFSMTLSSIATFTRSLSLSSSLSLSAETTLTSTMLARVSERISISTTFDVLSSTNVASQSNSRTLSHRSQTISNMTRPFNSLSVSHNSPSHQATNSQSISYWNCSALAEISGVMSPLREAAMTKFKGLVESFGVLQPATNHPTSLKFNNTVAVRMGLPSMRLDTVAMERLELLAALPLAMNFSILSPPFTSRWLVANITMSSTSLRWTLTKSSNIADPWWSILVEAPEPPNVWLGSTANFEDRTIELVATMSCDGGAVMQVVFVVPAPGIPQREYANEVKVAARYSQMVSAFASLSSGITVGRMMATRGLALCDAGSTGSGGLIDFHLRFCDNTEVDSMDPVVVARSAVLSNLLLQFLGAVVLTMCALVWSRVHKVAMLHAAAALCLPSTLLPLWVAQLQSTAAAVTLLIGRLNGSRCPASDTVLSVLCMIVAAAPVATILGVWLTRAHGKAPEWICTPSVMPNGRITSPIFLLRIRWLYERIFLRVWIWTPAPFVCTSRLERAWTLLLEYRLLWYSAVDSVVLQVLSCLSIVSGLNGSQSSCQALAFALAIILVAQLLLLLLVKPYTTLFSHVYSVVSLTLTTLSVIAQLLYLLASSTSSSGLWLLQASTICNLATLGVNAVKMLLDFVQLCRSVARRLGIDCSNISTVVTTAEEELVRSDVLGEQRANVSYKSVTVEKEVELFTDAPPPPSTPIFEHSSQQLLDDLGVLWIDHETTLAGSSDIIAIGRSANFDNRGQDFLSQYLSLMPPDLSH